MRSKEILLVDAAASDALSPSLSSSSFTSSTSTSVTEVVVVEVGGLGFVTTTNGGAVTVAAKVAGDALCCCGGGGGGGGGTEPGPTLDLRGNSLPAPLLVLVLVVEGVKLARRKASETAVVAVVVAVGLEGGVRSK